MRILAFDTTTRLLSACLWEDGDVRAGRSLAMERGHAEALVPLLGELLSEAGAGYGDLHALGVTCGPGAFTGIRIGLATARGLALAAGIPAVGVGTLTALAATAAGQAGAAAEHDWLAVLDTKRRDFYAQLFGPDGQSLGDPAIRTADDIAGMVRMGRATAVIGDATSLLGEAFEHPDITLIDDLHGPSAAAIATLAAAALGQAVGGVTAAPEPAYLRAPEARLPGQPT